MSKIEKSEKDLEEAYNKDNHDAKIVLDYGIKLLELEKLDKALTLYDYNFNLEDDTANEEVEKYFVALAKECSQKNKNRDAIKCCDYYLDKESGSVNVLKLKIELLSHLKRFDDALSCYDVLIELNNDEKLKNKVYVDQILCFEAKAFYQYNKGLFADSISTLALASEYYSQKYVLDEYILNSWHNHLKNNLSKYKDNGEEFFNNLFTVDTEDSMGWCNLIWYFTMRYDSYGDIDIMLCDWLLEKNPESIPILNKKAELHDDWKPTLSLKLYEKVLELREFDIDGLEGKLKILVKLKRYGKFKEYIQSLPNNVAISDALSSITYDLIKNKKYSEAIICYEKILEIDPSDVNAITQIKRIWDEAGMKEEKKNSKYYMDWIGVIRSHNHWVNCPEEGCYEKLNHIVHGIDGHRLIENPRQGKELIIKGYIDCDDNSTHYCPKCKKEYNLGVECINFDMDDQVLYEYAQSLILAVKHRINLDYPGGERLNYLEESLKKDYSIDTREFNAFMKKLEELEYINRKVELNWY